MRHGKAESHHPDGDRARPLAPKGRRQAERQAHRLAGASMLPAIVLSSPLVRARQTAESFCAAAGLPGPLMQDWIACGMSPDTALRELAGFIEFERVALVGHEPDLSTLLATLIGCGSASIRMKTGCIASLSIDPPSHRGTLNFLLPAKKGLAGECCTGTD